MNFIINIWAVLAFPSSFNTILPIMIIFSTFSTKVAYSVSCFVWWWLHDSPECWDIEAESLCPSNHTILVLGCRELRAGTTSPGNCWDLPGASSSSPELPADCVSKHLHQSQWYYDTRYNQSQKDLEHILGCHSEICWGCSSLQQIFFCKSYQVRQRHHNVHNDNASSDWRTL